MIVEVTEGREHHCGQIARRLRLEHRRILVERSTKVHHELRAAFDASIWRKALFVDGRLMAIAGVTGAMSSHEGDVWLAITEDAVGHPVRIARIVMDQLAEIMVVKRKLVTVVLKGDRRGLMFAYFLGFRADGFTEVSGIEALRMSYTAPEVR